MEQARCAFSFFKILVVLFLFSVLFLSACTHYMHSDALDSFFLLFLTCSVHRFALPSENLPYFVGLFVVSHFSSKLRLIRLGLGKGQDVLD